MFSTREHYIMLLLPKQRRSAPLTASCFKMSTSSWRICATLTNVQRDPFISVPESTSLTTRKLLFLWVHIFITVVCGVCEELLICHRQATFRLTWKCVTSSVVIPSQCVLLYFKWSILNAQICAHRCKCFVVVHVGVMTWLWPSGTSRCMYLCMLSVCCYGYFVLLVAEMIHVNTIQC